MKFPENSGEVIKVKRLSKTLKFETIKNEMEKYLFFLILQVLYHGIKSKRKIQNKFFFLVHPGTKSPFLGVENFLVSNSIGY